MEKIEELLSHLGEHTPIGDSGRHWEARCPTCGDGSLGVLRADDGVLVKCYAGCELSEIVANLGDGLFARELLAAAGKPGVTVNRLAFEKRLPVAWLRSYCGLVDDNRTVLIPYRGIEMQLLHYRVRSAVKATDGTRFQERNTRPAPYGLWLKREFLARSRDLIFVEGETDCWALWHHGLNAFGVPGAKNQNCIEADHVAGFERIFIWQEPDKSGCEFPQRVAERLRSLGANP